MNIQMTPPPALKTGDTIAIVAPAGPLAVRDVFDRSLALLQRLGFRVRFDERIFQADRYLAGSDADRADELLRALADPSVRAIVALRGGYGCARLIPRLTRGLADIADRDAGDNWAAAPKILMGFSDLTTLHLFFNRRGWITFHGPMAASVALAEMSAEGKRHIFSLWTDGDYRPFMRFANTECWSPGVAEGIITGGCLSLVTASLGTAYEIETEGRLLFLEDCGEPPYRIDRMLTHLRLAGKLDGLAGILLGPFPDCDPLTGGYSINDILRDLLADLGVPVLANFPAGHVTDNRPFPFGVRARLDAANHSLRFLDAAVR